MATIIDSATYTRLRDGSWGLRIASGNVKAGDEPTVTKRDGSRKMERVERVLWTDGTTSLCTIAARNSGSSRAARPRYDADGYRVSRRTRLCVTGGNCSSFGSGRSCGGRDCDGY